MKKNELIVETNGKIWGEELVYNYPHMIQDDTLELEREIRQLRTKCLTNSVADIILIIFIIYLILK